MGLSKQLAELKGWVWERIGDIHEEINRHGSRISSRIDGHLEVLRKLREDLDLLRNSTGGLWKTMGGEIMQIRQLSDTHLASIMIGEFGSAAARDLVQAEIDRRTWDDTFAEQRGGSMRTRLGDLEETVHDMEEAVHELRGWVNPPRPVGTPYQKKCPYSFDPEAEESKLALATAALATLQSVTKTLTYEQREELVQILAGQLNVDL